MRQGIAGICQTLAVRTRFTDLVELTRFWSDPS